MTFKIVALIFALLLILPYVFAAEVAYIYKNEKRVGQGFLEAFDEMNMDVGFINDKDLMSTSLSSYEVVFVGDEILRNHAKISSSGKPLVIANHYYVKQFGIVDKGGT